MAGGGGGPYAQVTAGSDAGLTTWHRLQTSLPVRTKGTLHGGAEMEVRQKGLGFTRRHFRGPPGWERCWGRCQLPARVSRSVEEEEGGYRAGPGPDRDGDTQHGGTPLGDALKGVHRAVKLVRRGWVAVLVRTRSHGWGGEVQVVP